MKWVLCLVLFLSLASAQVPIPVGQFAKKPSGAAAPTYLLSEGFEGTGYETASWSVTGSPDPDYTGVVLDGSQSFRVNVVSDQAYIDHAITSGGEVWVYMLFRRISGIGTPVLFRLLDSGGTAKATLYYVSGQFAWYDDTSGNNATPADSISDGTTYSVWLHYKKSTGANDAICEIGFSTTTTKPTSGTKYAIISNGTGTANLDYIRVGSSGSVTDENIYDYIRVDDVNIGSAPP